MLTKTARVGDVLLVMLGAFMAHLLRYDIPFGLTDTEKLLIAFNCVLVLLLFPTFGVYQTWRGKALGDLLSRVAGSWLVVATVSLLLVFTLHRAESVSRLWLSYATFASGTLLVLERLVVYSMLHKVRRLGLNQKSVVIVGSEGFARAILKQIQRRPEAGFQVVCMFDENRAASSAETMVSVAGEPSNALIDPPTQARPGAIRVMSDFAELVRLVRSQQIAEIWLALPLSEERALLRFVREFRHEFVNLRFMPDVRSMSLFNHSVVDVLGMPAINLAASPLSTPDLWPKLVFDRLFAGLVLICLLPLFIVIGVLIKLTSPGPVLFTQKRKGIDGRPFDIYKFRSMKTHVETLGSVTQASRDDPRITPIGAFLRRTSLDELPQFINVLYGQMSVVGPRPHALEHDDLYKDLVDGYMYRYRIKPGITGWAQVNGYRGATTKVEKMDARVKFDLFYIENWSFWFDIKIVMITMIKGFISRNAY